MKRLLFLTAFSVLALGESFGVGYGDAVDCRNIGYDRIGNKSVKFYECKVYNKPIKCYLVYMPGANNGKGSISWSCIRFDRR